MTRLNQIVNLQKSTFAEKIAAVFVANPINEEQAGQLLSDLVFAEQTHGAIGEATFTVFDYEPGKDWLQTLIVTAVSLRAPQHGAQGLAIEKHFLDAWIETGRTRALSDMIAAEAESESGSCCGGTCLCRRKQSNVAKLFSADTTSSEIVTIYRLALARHVLVMTERYPDLLVEKGIFASLL